MLRLKYARTLHDSMSMALHLTQVAVAVRAQVSSTQTRDRCFGHFLWRECAGILKSGERHDYGNIARVRGKSWPAVKVCSHSSLLASYLQTQWAIPRCSRAKTVRFLRLTQPYHALQQQHLEPCNGGTQQSLLPLSRSTGGRIRQWCCNCQDKCACDTGEKGVSITTQKRKVSTGC